MFQVLSCIAQQHDYLLVLLAAVICSATIFSSFKIYAHSLTQKGNRRLWWLVLTGVCTASGIWATHFVAMLAYDAGLPLGYDPILTAASFVIAALATTTGYTVAAEPRSRLGGLGRSGGSRGKDQGRLDGRWSALEVSIGQLLHALGSAAGRAAALGGAIIGAGIGAMHFTGMSALVIAGKIEWDVVLVLASLAVGIGLTSAAMLAGMAIGRAKALWIAPGLLILAICGLHFTAMGAATIVPDPTINVEPSRIDSTVLAIAVAAVTAFVLLAGLAAVVIERLTVDLASHIQKLEAANADVTKLNRELASNIDKLKAAQDEIVKKGKLAQLGQLTATVAHEIRNPLGAVRTATFLIERKIKNHELGLEKEIARINNGIKRCDSIITELLDFARSKTLQLNTVDLDEWVRQTVQEQRKGLPSILDVRFELGLAGVAAPFDVDRMRRVLINLLTNAAEAMVGKESDSGARTPEPRITVRTCRVGDNVEIAVIDNGPGISEENLARVLEPLFTTKSFGVGLGLPAVEKILEQHGGGLRVESRLGEGATFTAWFPIANSNRLAA